jgi:hypothetical protein
VTRAGTIGPEPRQRFIILDFADGSRRTIGMDCGPETGNGLYPVEVCHAAEFELWRVAGS